MRILNVARGPLVVDADLQAALDSGKVGGAALDVFRSEPVTDHPLFGYPNVIVTPHLGASTAEATDRAGYQAAEQVRGRADRRRRDERGQRAGDLGRGHGRARAVRVRCAARSGRIAVALAEGSSIDRCEIEFLGPDRRARHPPALDPGRCSGCCAGTPRRTSTRSTRRRWPTSAGSRWSRRSASAVRDYTDLVRVTVDERR